MPKQTVLLLTVKNASGTRKLTAALCPVDQFIDKKA
jgi:hypothetical protein